MSNLSNDEENHEDVQTNDEPHDTDGASATSWSDLDASTSPNDDERLVDKIIEVTLYREDWSDFDTTAEAEAERYGEDVDVTILDERPDDPGPDVATERLESVAERHISASWDAQVGTGTVTLTGERSALDLTFVLAWTPYRDDGATYFDGRTAGILLDGRDLFADNPLADREAVASPRELIGELETALEMLHTRAVGALRDRATSLLVEARQLDGMGSGEEE